MPSTTEVAFQQFISDISPTKTEWSRASTSHNYIRQVLSNWNGRDPSFPRIQRDFLIGSAIRRTKTSPMDDIDVFEVMDGSGLYLLEQERVVTAIIEGSGQQPNSLLQYCDGDGFLNSVRVLNKFRSALTITYPDSKVNRDGQAVTVYLPSPGFSIDIVPAVYVHSIPFGTPRYYIPIGHGSREWKATNPDLDKKRIEEANKIHNNIASHIVRLIKFWNQHRNYGRLGSYHVEAMCLSLLGAKPIQTYAEGIFRAKLPSPACGRGGRGVRARKPATQF